MSDCSIKIQNREELNFAVFCIENLALRLNMNAVKIYKALKQSGILDEYIVANYEALHTQDKEYILNDILEVMQMKGVKI